MLAGVLTSCSRETGLQATDEAPEQVALAETTTAATAVDPDGLVIVKSADGDHTTGRLVSDERASSALRAADSRAGAQPLGFVAPGDPLAEPYSSSAALAGDGSKIVYASWEPLGQHDVTDPLPQGTPLGRPSIRVLDLVTGSDTLLVDGAVGFAVSPEGLLAFVKGDDPDCFSSVPYGGTIQVLDLDHPSETQVLVAQSATWRVAGWAGENLLAYNIHSGEYTDLYKVAPAGAPEMLVVTASVVAVSPNGQRVVVQRQGTDRYEVAILDVETGSVAVEEIEDPEQNQSPIGSVIGRGDWGPAGIVAQLPGGLASVSPIDLSVEARIPLDAAIYPWGITDPHFGNDERVHAIARIPGDVEPRGQTQAQGSDPGTVLSVSCTFADQTCQTSDLRGIGAMRVERPGLE